jgi:hypothetical protein
MPESRSDLLLERIFATTKLLFFGDHRAMLASM